MESVADFPDSRTTVLSFLEDTYERTLIVDGESATIILLDMWENKVRGARRWQWVPRGPAFQRAGPSGAGAGVALGPVLFRVLGEVGPFASLDASFPPKVGACSKEEATRRRALNNKQVAAICL